MGDFPLLQHSSQMSNYTDGQLVSCPYGISAFHKNLIYLKHL